MYLKSPEAYCSILTRERNSNFLPSTDLLARKKNGTMTEEEHNEVVDWLLQKPNLIIADEAHSFKNQHSLLWKAMTRFRSKSRVALTGSPLSNSLDEYYTIIDWIAPNYLGSLTEFKAYYMEPIKVRDLWESLHEYDTAQRPLCTLLLGICRYED